MKLPKHEIYEMYYAVYPNGEKSADFYNYARAYNHTLVLAETEPRTSRRMPGKRPRKLTDELF